jgi:BNR repeat-like domain
MKRTSLIIGVLGIFLCAQAAQALWTTAKRITWTSGASIDPVIALDSQGHIHVVWYDDTPGNGEIYYKKSTDGGTTWTGSKRLTWTSASSAGAALAIDSSDNLYLAWQDLTPGNFEIYCKKSTDGGNTWTGNQRITWNQGGSYQPALAVDSSGYIHLLWSDATPGNCEIYYKKSTDGGASWSASKRLTWTATWSGGLAIAVDSADKLHAFWYDYAPGNSELYYTKSTDGGSTWKAGQRLTWTSGSSYYPAVAVDSSGIISLAWDDNTPGNYEIYYKKSTDGGTTWTAGRRLAWPPSDCTAPAIAADSFGNPLVVWPNSAPGKYDLYYSKSTDGGATWATSKRLTWTPGDSSGPAMVIDTGNTVHIVWDDYTPGNYEIYYLKGK